MMKNRSLGDEFEQWLLEAGLDTDDEEMGEAENNEELVV